MDIDLLLSLVKSNLGIGSTFRDDYLKNLIKGVLDELEKEKGIVLDPENFHHIMFITDLAAWRFTARDTPVAMPKHLLCRLRDLFVKSGGGPVVPA